MFNKYSEERKGVVLCSHQAGAVYREAADEYMENGNEMMAGIMTICSCIAQLQSRVEETRDAVIELHDDFRRKNFD